MTNYTVECKSCGVLFGKEKYTPKCSSCGRAVDIFYDYSGVEIQKNKSNMLDKYRDILPIPGDSFTYKFPIPETPLIYSKKISEICGSNIYLKYEGSLKTKSTKDRMAPIALAFLEQHGVKEITMSSTGNSSTSIGTIAHLFPNMKIHIFVGTDFKDRLNIPDSSNVVVHIIEGNFILAGKKAKEYAAKNNLVFEGGFFNPGRREGLKLTYLEAIDQAPQEPTVVIQATSSGMGLYGAFKGFTEYRITKRLTSIPRIVCAQQKSCAPMYNGWTSKKISLDDSDVIKEPQGLAYAILRGDARETYQYMRSIVDYTGGCFEAVDDVEIKNARRLAEKHEGLDVCNASSVALACAIKLSSKNWINSDDRVIVNLTGADRTSVN